MENNGIAVLTLIKASSIRELLELSVAELTCVAPLQSATDDREANLYPKREKLAMISLDAATRKPS